MQVSKERVFLSDWKFVVGTILCFLNAFIVGTIHVGVLFLFGIPLILLTLGIVLLLFSRADERAKALVVLATIALIPLTFALSIYLSSAEPETFLIPSDYRGQIVVFYDEPCGSNAVYENGRRVYTIGNDGVLITKTNENSGYLNRSFFYVNEKGERSAIPEFRRQNFETEQKEWGMYSHPVPFETFTHDTVGVFGAYGTTTYGISRNSMAYYVWSYNDFGRDDTIRSKEIAEFGKKAGLILSSCRESDSQ